MIKQYDDIRKIATGQGDDCTTGCFLDCQYFKDHYNLISIDLSKQKELDADSRAIQQIEFYTMFFKGRPSSVTNVNGWIQ